MGLLYRNLKITVGSLGTWYKQRLYLDKKITHTLAVSSDNNRVGSPIGLEFSISNGYELMVEQQPINLIYGGSDAATCVKSRQLFPLSEGEGLLNKDGFLEVAVRYTPQPPDYEYLPPYEAPVNESLPADPVTNPIIFKYPFDVNFRFQCKM